MRPSSFNEQEKQFSQQRRGHELRAEEPQRNKKSILALLAHP